MRISYISTLLIIYRNINKSQAIIKYYSFWPISGKEKLFSLPGGGSTADQKMKLYNVICYPLYINEK